MRGVRYNLELLCYLPKPCFEARVMFGDNQFFSVYRQINAKILTIVGIQMGASTSPILLAL